MVGSLFTLEETIFILFFSRILLGEAKKRGYNNIKEFRRCDPGRFSNLYASRRNIVHWIVKQAGDLGVSFDHPKYSNPNLDATVRIRDSATRLLYKYDVLDGKDAFHIAVAKCMGIDMLINCDGDFETVTEIEQYNPIA
jgi:hypothetical protein